MRMFRDNGGGSARIGFRLLPLVLACLSVSGWGAELRFPPPDFESGYAMPLTEYPAARGQVWEYLDVFVLVACLGVATWLVHRSRSRRGLLWLSAFSVAYFGFYREGCVCAIGSIQNVALAMFGSGYGLPVGVAVFFAAPLLVALFFGRSFCAGVCPHGALQDLVLVKPVTIPRWLETGLGILPFLYLGLGVTFAATGAAFVICRYDPFVPIFRLSGSVGMLLFGGTMVLLGMFVGRPYCRFLCPYGALLKIASALAKWRVRVTPDLCTQCRLCPGSCPFGVIREPDPGLTRPREVAVARRRLVWLLAVVPLVLAAGAGAGWWFGGAAARLHPTVELADRHAARLTAEAVARLTLPKRLALTRAEKQSAELGPQAAELRARFRTAGLWFGIWAGAVLAIRWVSQAMVRRRAEYEPDRAGCFACARCFSSCPQERIRLGLAPLPAIVSPHVVPTSLHPVPSAKSGGCGCSGAAAEVPEGGRG